jgi:hypothetical protein
MPNRHLISFVFNGLRNQEDKTETKTEERFLERNWRVGGPKKQALVTFLPYNCTMNGHGNGYHSGHNSSGYGNGGASSSSSSSSRYANHDGNSQQHERSSNGGIVVPTVNGHSHSNGHAMSVPYHLKNGMTSQRLTIAHPEMCFFCFDVLYSNLNNVDPPKPPSFTNDSL